MKMTLSQDSSDSLMIMIFFVMQIFIIRTRLLISKNIKGFLMTFLAQLNSRLQKGKNTFLKDYLEELNESTN